MCQTVTKVGRSQSVGSPKQSEQSCLFFFGLCNGEHSNLPISIVVRYGSNRSNRLNTRYGKSIGRVGRFVTLYVTFRFLSVSRQVECQLVELEWMYCDISGGFSHVGQRNHGQPAWTSCQLCMHHSSHRSPAPYK